MSAETLLDGLSEAKTLVSLYSEYAKSAPHSVQELKNTQGEMKIIKSQILGNLSELKKLVKRLETGVKL